MGYQDIKDFGSIYVEYSITLGEALALLVVVLDGFIDIQRQ